MFQFCFSVFFLVQNVLKTSWPQLPPPPPPPNAADVSHKYLVVNIVQLQQMDIVFSHKGRTNVFARAIRIILYSWVGQV
jgi:hypothetical protein